jgi:cell division septation protein DedD/nucleoid DNA-binding protein
MKTVAEYIRTLLYEYDYVTVPNFGAFIANYQPASVNEISGSLMPPQKKIAFNELLKQDDGLLAMQIARRESISIDESKRRIQQFVEEVKDNLAFQRFFTFEKIGTFSLNDETNIVFEPDRRNNFFSESFGFDSLFPKSEEKEKYVYSEEQTTSDYYTYTEKKNSSFSFVLYGLPIILLSTGLFYVLFSHKPVRNTAYSSLNPLDYIPKTEKKNEIVRPTFEKKEVAKQIVVDSPVEVSNKVDENSSENPSKLSESKKVESSKIFPQPVATTPTISENTIRYVVIAGLFKNASNAQNLVDKFTATGLNARIEKVKEFSKVIAAEVNTKEEAKIIAEKIKSISGDKGIVQRK